VHSRDVGVVNIPTKESLNRRRASDGFANLSNHQKRLEKIYNNTLGNQVGLCVVFAN
jgi:hypothetical protein